MPSDYRTLPAIHRLLSDSSLHEAIATHGRQAVVAACRHALAELRHRLAAGELPAESLSAACGQLPATVLARLQERAREAYPAVVNATGVLLHTNLGRAPLITPLPTTLASYLALEYDLASGQRGQRLAPLGERLAHLCGCERALAVNNNAAALVLILAAHARGREVVVSRGQLIEIGGSFRLPDVMEASGARLVEVGCTNHTHLEDYARAIRPETAAVLVAHPSNYRIVGFTSSPPLAELAELAHQHQVGLIVDQGTGSLHDLTSWGVADEPTVADLLRQGADLVCFSGDKLLGGPQAGVVVGRKAWVEPLERHPLYRALRPDKMALAVMDAVVAAHQSGRLQEIPLYALLGTPVSDLKRRARALGRHLRKAGVAASEEPSAATLGGGTTPAETIESFAVTVPGSQDLLAQLRRGVPPVIARVEADRVILDLRAVFPGQDRSLAAAVVAAWRAVSGPGATS